MLQQASWAEPGILAELAVREAHLEERFSPYLRVNPDLTRALVSFQANKREPSYRWFKFKEGFSAGLVHYLIDKGSIAAGRVLDPFAGSGTALFVTSDRELDATGIELLPIGCEIIKLRKVVASRSKARLQEALERWLKKRPWMQRRRGLRFPHLRITMNAFPAENELALGRYLSAITSERNRQVAQLLRFAALCVLEDISYTRKDGQYLRWDYRTGRFHGTKRFSKGKIKSFDEAITQKLGEILVDLSGHELLQLGHSVDRPGKVELIQGSCLRALPQLDTASFDCLITSPPYCNRYDYTRTYALELALLGVDEAHIRKLRQEMMSCTVENRDKENLQAMFSTTTFLKASEAFKRQEQLQLILQYLDYRRAEGSLNNPGIVRMVRNYFYEMALVIFECARVLRPGAPFFMVNDNVRYAGTHVPVDLILSDFALKAGFDVEAIWVLPNGKGNSSQQMGEHGRQELRKCVYVWRRV